ncbi:MAG: PTS sugar transporter subunit IIC [Clostridiales bacterium]|nr:PTS sugar transporter subunit IIC [Clostridiales bacterium]
MKKVKSFLSYIFIDGLSGMALGLFATLIIGTILAQIASFVPGQIGRYLTCISSVAKVLTGAGIGAGLASKYKVSPLTGVSAAVSGMVGAFASKLVAAGTADISTVFTGPGDPLGAFIAAFTAIQVGRLISGKTKLDLLLTPALSITAGSFCGLYVGPPASMLTSKIGELIEWGTQRQPFLMGIVVAVIMGMCLTLPISSAAIAIILGLDGIAGGAAVVGCSAQMIGFAVASYRENRLDGLIAQGAGTSMLQMPNIIRHPQIWIPPIVASAVLGPVSTKLLGMTCLASGAGMGTSGFVGQFMTYNSMTADGVQGWVVIAEIIVMHFVAPALITLGLSEIMRKINIIKPGDMELKDVN